MLPVWLFTIGFAQQTPVVVHVRFDSNVPPDITVVPAILKYNKDFAYSFTFDDAYSDAYNLGLKFWGGGYSPLDGNTYPGLFYTNGCGNRIPFRAGVSWYTANTSNSDIHFNTPGYISYSGAVNLYNSGWDFFNHSYNHDANSGSVNFISQLNSNRQVFENNTGIDLYYCVPPSGDIGYLGPAFSLGDLACFTSSNGYLGYLTGVDATVSVPGNPVYWRNLINSDDDNSASLIAAFDKWVATTGQGQQKWWNEFTHRIDYGHIAASMEFREFKTYFEYLEQKYGSKGSDNGWFANGVEVFEYLMVRDHVAVTFVKNGSLLDITLNYSLVPVNLRYYDLSLLVKGSGNISSVSLSGQGIVSNVKTTNGHLINIDLPDAKTAGMETARLEKQVFLRGFPNPATENYYLEIPDGVTNTEVTIVNSRFETMPNPSFTQSDRLIEINLKSASYPPGLYLISVYSKGICIGTSKVIIDL